MTATTFDAFLGQIAGAAVDGSVTIDLTAGWFVDLFAMVGLAYTCADLEARGVSVRFEVAEDALCSFLHRVGFFGVLAPTIGVPSHVSRGQLGAMAAYFGANPALLELTPIDCDQAINDVLDKLLAVLQGQLALAAWSRPRLG